MLTCFHFIVIFITSLNLIFHILKKSEKTK